MFRAHHALPVLLLAAVAGSCSQSAKAPDVLVAEGFREEMLQEKLIQASRGDTIRLGAGEFRFTRSISLDGISGVTLTGAGAGKTTLSFAGQVDGAEGLYITADSFTVQDLAVVDAAGDAIKIKDGAQAVIRRVRVAWSGGPKASNGAYGLYPVGCQGVLIEDCEVSDASDAGIYVGQSRDIIVRNNKVYHNVAGIEIENSFHAVVHDNEAYNNTGGILVFDLPELPVKNGRDVKVHSNTIYDNNLPNFAPEGNMVGIIPAGTGVLVMSTREVEVYDNSISNHQSFSAAVVSYLMTGKAYEDVEYDPFADRISIRNNSISNDAGLQPDTTRELGALIQQLFGGDTPEILTDGIQPPDRALELCISGNADARIATLDAGNAFAGLHFDPSPYACAEPSDVP
jgi:parallel beta-helix repeat protein